MWQRATAAIALIAVVAVLIALRPPSVSAQPQISETDPPAEAVLGQPPPAIRICFTEPVVYASTKDFNFSVFLPDGSRLGARIVFSTVESCVDVEPGWPPQPPAGQYRVDWQVRAQADNEPSAGSFSFTVQGTPLPVTPAATPSPAIAGGEENGRDILPLALITAAAVLGAGAVGLVLHLVRQRLGFWLHRPPPEGGDKPDEEHHP